MFFNLCLGSKEKQIKQALNDRKLRTFFKKTSISHFPTVLVTATRFINTVNEHLIDFWFRIFLLLQLHSFTTNIFHTKLAEKQVLHDNIFCGLSKGSENSFSYCP